MRPHGGLGVETEGIGLVALRGPGKGFCAGKDIKEMSHRLPRRIGAAKGIKMMTASHP